MPGARGYPGCRLTLRQAVLALFLLAPVAPLAPAETNCPAVVAPVTTERYSLTDVRSGRLPDSLAIRRATVAVGAERLDVVAVTDADRAWLAADWPPFPRDVRLMLVALETGEVLWSLRSSATASAEQTFASDPRLSAPLGSAAVLTGEDGLAQRLYAGDAAGWVWRIDLPPLPDRAAAAVAWQVDLLAALQRQSASDSVRFRLPPDLLRSVDALGVPFDGVILAAEGAAPDSPTGGGNGLYFLRDYAVSPRRATDPPLAVIVASDLAPAAAAAGDGAGWFTPFSNPTEVAQDSAHTDGGRVFLVTAAPPAVCDEPPLALTYVFNVADGRPLTGTLPATVAGMGWLGGPRLQGGEILLPGRGIAVRAEVDGGTARFQARFRAAGIGAAIRYWRDLLLDAD